MRYLLILAIIQFLLTVTINSTTNVNNELLEKVRTGFAELAKNSTDFHPKDVESVKSDPEFLEPYLINGNDSAVILRNLVQKLKRNKELGLNDVTDQTFPKSVYQLGYIGLLGKDREGRQILLIRLKAWRKSPQLYKLMLPFVLYVFNKVDMKRPYYPGALIICDHGAEQPDHWRDDADDGEVAVARAEQLRLPQTVFRQRVVEHVLAAADALQARLEGVGEIVAVGVADFPGFLIVAGRDDLSQRGHERRGCETVGAQREDVLDHEGDHRDGSAEDGAPDGESEGAAAEDGLEDALLRGARAGGRRGFLRRDAVGEQQATSTEHQQEK